MATILQRLKRMSATDPAKQRRWLRARKWALERAADHTVHMDGETVCLFPDGGFAAAKTYSDADLCVFIEFLYLAQAQYVSFYTGVHLR